MSDMISFSDFCSVVFGICIWLPVLLILILLLLALVIAIMFWAIHRIKHKNRTGKLSRRKSMMTLRPSLHTDIFAFSCLHLP